MCSVAGQMACVLWAASASADEAMLHRLSETAVGRHPRIAEARENARAAWADYRGEDGFFDPAVLGAVGAARDERALPGVRRGTPSFSNSAAVQAGLEWAFLPGAYLGIGVVERRYFDPPEDRDGRFQRTVGVRLRVPLHRDRGFLDWREGKTAARAALAAALGEWLQAEQDLRRDVALRLIDWLHAETRREVANAAAQRAAQLQAEAEERVQLDTLPAYQVLPARLEAALRLDELAEAEQAILNARRRLVELADHEVPETVSPEKLLAWSAEIGAPNPMPDTLELERVGRFQSAWADGLQAAAELRRARDRRRSDLDLEIGYTWQGEGDRTWERAEGPYTERPGSGEAAIVWRHRWGARSERAEADAAHARLDARRERIETIAREQKTQVEVAHRGWGSARDRLERIREAVGDARAALDAETERFRLGEGASRLVLEAQKDLTAAQRRKADVAAELLRERARFFHATGAEGAPKGFGPPESEDHGTKAGESADENGASIPPRTRHGKEKSAL